MTISPTDQDRIFSVRRAVEGNVPNLSLLAASA